jgi:hypothetical protein
MKDRRRNSVITLKTGEISSLKTEEQIKDRKDLATQRIDIYGQQ